MVSTIGSLFSGIGGLELGLERAGLGRVVWQVEQDATCRGVLAHHWPDVARFNDVRTVTAIELSPVDVMCGGFPCQPVSLAGARAGDKDDRWLWPEFARLISELKPRVVVLENVLGLRSCGLRAVLADLAALGFDAEWSDISACSVGAPHERRRIFIVATDPTRVAIRRHDGWLSRGLAERAKGIDREHVEAVVAANSDGVRRLESAWRIASLRGWPEHSCGPLGASSPVDDGIPRGLVGFARKALGNAVVPQVAEAVGLTLLDAMGVIARAA